MNNSYSLFVAYQEPMAAVSQPDAMRSACHGNETGICDDTGEKRSSPDTLPFSCYGNGYGLFISSTGNSDGRSASLRNMGWLGNTVSAPGVHRLKGFRDLAILL